MSSNYHTPYTTATLFKDTDMNPPLASLDAAITTLNNIQSESSITCASTFEVSFATVETRFLSLTTNASCIISNGVNGHKYKLRVTQDTTGNWTLDIGATAGSIKWKGGAAPTISTGATVSDILTFMRSNGTWFGEADQGY